ncbi:helix-turn-helix domain-containing protein [Microvirga massiliensis]|uniref:helix-turn-helix domain-containing protein n=1 Tax=Microvirga massiliensis TaxID=1033741 RepID=UPI00062B8E4A|nr:helix-turn-helix domain-containing protein [Microvirga massiliensis]
MVSQSPVAASFEQRRDLMALSRSRDRGEADRARAVQLTLSGWPSPRVAEAFGFREDTMRLWCSAFMKAGVQAL